MGKQKKIPLRTQDAILRLWLAKTKANSNPRIINPLVRQAVIQYIKTKSFICIGKICCTSDMKLPNTMSIQMCFQNDSEIDLWLATLHDNNLNSSEIIRQILLKSISIVKTVEDEWYPSYLDLNTMSLGETITIPDTKNVTEQPITLVKSIHNEINKVQETPVQPPEPLGIKSNNKKPMCSSMFSDDDW